MGEAGNSCLLPASEAPNGESQPRGLGTAAGERVTRAGGRRWLSGALPPYFFSRLRQPSLIQSGGGYPLRSSGLEC